MFLSAHKAVAFSDASGIAFPDGGLGEEHIRAAYLAFSWDEFGHYLTAHLKMINAPKTMAMIAATTKPSGW